MACNYNDSPVLKCGLGREKWHENILNQIKTANPPKVMAIHGTWGSGKTSMMAQLYRALGGDTNRWEAMDIQENSEAETEHENAFFPVWFEAWQYQHDENILAALIWEIYDQIKSVHERRGVWEKIRKAGRSASDQIMATIRSIEFELSAFGAKLKVRAKDIAENREGIQNKRQQIAPLNSHKERVLLQEAINKLLSLGKTNEEKKRRKAIIFIDDLDRCEAEVAYGILEAIKVYLNLNNCIFVLGMDVKSIDLIIERFYKNIMPDADDRAVRNMARLYMEKICQDVFHLPIPTQEQRKNYFSDLLKANGQSDAMLVDELVKIADENKILPPFPRSVKMYANIVLHHIDKLKELPPSLNSNEKEKAYGYFLIMTYLYTFHYELYQICQTYPDFYKNSFVKFCKDPEEQIKDQGKHPILDGLIVPRNPKELANALKAAGAREAHDQLMSATYPHANLRSVLWIAPLVVETKEVADGLCVNL